MTSFTHAFHMLGTGLNHSLHTVGGNVPVYAAAFVIVLLGVVAGYLAKWIVELILSSIKLESVAKSVSWHQVFTGRYSAIELVGEFVRWFFILVFFVQAMAALQVPQVGSLVHSLLAYVPHVFAAMVVLGVGGIFAMLASRLVETVARLVTFGYARLLGSLTRLALWVVWVLVALGQLGLPRSYINFLFYPVVVFLALSLGLAFGLGCRDVAKDFWNSRRDFFRHEV